MAIYTEGQKRYILKQEGYDANMFDIADDGTIIDRAAPIVPPPAPEPTPEPTPAPPPGVMDTGFRAFKQGILPTAAAVGAGIAAAPITGGLGSIPAFLATLGITTAAGLGAGKVQEAITPDGIAKEHFLRPEDAANPIAQTVGGLIPNAITHNPITGVKDIGRVLSKLPAMVKNPLFAGKALTDAEALALKNAAAGAGAGGGVNAALQLAQKGEIDPTELAGAVAGGTIFNNPYNNRFNRAIGLTPTPESTPISPEEVAVPRTWAPDNFGVMPKAEVTADIINKIHGLPPQPLAPKEQAIVDRELAKLNLRKATENRPMSAQEALIQESGPPIVSREGPKLSPEELLASIDPSATRTIVPKFLSQEEAIKQGGYQPISRPDIIPGIYTPKEIEQLIAARNRDSARAAEELRLANLGPKVEPTSIEPVVEPSPYDAPLVPANRSELKETPGALTIPLEEFKAKIKFEEEAALARIQAAARAAEAKSEPNKLLPIDNGPVPIKVSKSTQALLAKKNATGKATTEAIVPNAVAKPTQEVQGPKVIAEGLPIGEGTTPDPYNAYKQGQVNPANTLPITPQAEAIAARRGVHIKEEPTLPSDIQGLSNASGRQVRLNPKNSDTATLGHEAVGHQFVKDLRASKDAKDRALVSNMESMAKRLGHKDQQAIDEFIADAIGEDFSRRIQLRLTGTAKEKFRSWVKDLRDSWAYYRGNNEPAASLTALRSLTDAPYGTRKEIVNEPKQQTPALSGTISQSATDKSRLPSEESNQEVRAGSRGTKEGTGRVSGSGQSDATTESERASVKSAGRDKAKEHDKPERSNPSESNSGKREGEEGTGRVRESSNPIAKGSDTGTGSRENSSSSASSSANEGTKSQRLDNTEDTAFSQGKATAGKEDAPAVVNPKDNGAHFSIPGIRSQVDALEAKAQEIGPKGPVAVNALKDFANKHSEYNGKYRESLMYNLQDMLGIKPRPGQLSNWIKGDSMVAREVIRYMDAASDGLELPKVSTKAKEVVKAIREVLVEIRQDQNSREGLRKGGEDPDYFPQTLARQVVDVIKNKPNSLEGLRYKRDYIKYVSDKIVEKSKGKVSAEKAKEQAETLYSNLLKGFSKENINLAKHFGPIDDAVGYGIPPSMRETNLIRRLNNYLERASLRIAHYDALEADPKIKDTFFGKEGVIANDTVRAIYHRMGGIRPPTETAVEAVTGIIKAAVTGTFSGVRDIATVPVLGAQHQDFLQTPRTALKSALQIKNNWKESFEAGINRTHIGSLESGDADGGFSGGIHIAHRIRDLTNEVQLRNWLEQVSRAWAYTNGKVIAHENLASAAGGNISAQQRRFLNEFAPKGWEKNLKALLKDSDAIKKMGRGYADSVVGTYDSKGLPSWAMEGPIAPIFSLNRWSIEKTNNFIKHTIDPMIKDGDFRPFLYQTAYLMLGGAGVEQLNEFLSRRKSKLPAIDEIKAAEKLGGSWKEGLAYKAIGLAALGGWAGEMSNFAKMWMDHKYKNNDRWYNLLAVEFAHKTTRYSESFINAMAEGDVSLAMDIADDYLSSYLQTWRVISKFINEGKQLDAISADENRDVKVFKQLMDKELGEIPSDTIRDYSKERQREFHKARTIEDAVAKAPGAIKEAFKNAKTNEDYDSAARGLQSNSYRGFPSMENAPQTAMEFYKFLEESQGPEEARKRFTEALRMSDLNKTKRKMVPKP